MSILSTILFNTYVPPKGVVRTVAYKEEAPAPVRHSRRNEIHGFILDSIKSGIHTDTEIAVDVGVSKSCVYQNLCILHALGKVTKERDSALKPYLYYIKSDVQKC